MDAARSSTTSDPRVERILAIVAEETGIERSLLQPEASIEELGIASLDMTQAVFRLETEFDIEIPVIAERAGAEFGTVGDLLAHVLAVLDRRAAAPPGSAG
ncbi:MAG: acyl carrier protein [Acidisphaera sp.]|nr:acyl carrier protein [Acidisphaera sp.]